MSSGQPARALPASIPAWFPLQSWNTGAAARTCVADSASIGHPAGLRSAETSSPARRNSRRTARTCTGSPLCEEHITAISGTGTGTSIAPSEIAAWIGFMHERANATRAGSPTEANSRPVASQTATSPRCTDSTTPDRTTRAIGTDPIVRKRSAADRVSQCAATAESSSSTSGSRSTRSRKVSTMSGSNCVQAPIAISSIARSTVSAAR